MQRVDNKEQYSFLRKKRAPNEELSFSDVINLTMKLKQLSDPNAGYTANLLWAWTEDKAHKNKVASSVAQSRIKAGLFGNSPKEGDIKKLEENHRQHHTDYHRVMNELKETKPR